MATKLTIYNKALGHLGPVRLHPTNGLTENRVDRRELDARWDGAMQEMLEHGIWRFAIRSFEMTADPNIVPAFGPQFGFDLPDDYVRLHKIATDPELSNEDLTYVREGPKRIFSHNQVLYLSIVSNRSDYGGNLGAYSELYAEAFGLLLASKACVAITQDQNLEAKLLGKFETLYLPRAKRKDAIDERVKFRPVGSWVKSRFAASRGGYRGRIA